MRALLVREHIVEIAVSSIRVVAPPFETSFTRLLLLPDAAGASAIFDRYANSALAVFRELVIVTDNTAKELPRTDTPDVCPVNELLASFVVHSR